MATKTKAPPRGAKTARIRQMLDENPDAMPKDISDMLQKEGISASAALISSVKSKTKTEVAGAQLSLNQLIAARKLVQEMGGIEQAKQAIDALAQLSI